MSITSCNIRGGARILVRGEQRAKFHTWIPLKSCTTMASPKFRFGKTFSKNVLIKDFCKLKNLFTKLHKNLKSHKNFTSSYYRGAHGFIIIHDVTDKSSFENLRNWIAEIDKYGTAGTSKILVGNKTDLSENRTVPRDEWKQLAKDLGIYFLETSSKKDLNMDEAFKWLVQDILKSSIIRNALTITPILSSSNGKNVTEA